jgi:conjugative transposon TraN protein
MKRMVCWLLMAFGVVSLKGQTTLCISTDKTVSLVFPYAVKHVDRGTQSVLAQSVKDAPEILLVKAAQKNFAETNLSVVTADGSVYTFLICYDVNPGTWVYHLPVNKKEKLETYAMMLMDNEPLTNKIKDSKLEMSATVCGIYIKDEIIFYQLKIQNESPVDYDIDMIRFFIKDKKKSKRTAVQENEIVPLYVGGNSKLIKANTETVIVYAFEKFTIPDAKFMGVQIMEKNGGRHLFLKVTNKRIMQGKILPDLK